MQASDGLAMRVRVTSGQTSRKPTVVQPAAFKERIDACLFCCVTQTHGPEDTVKQAAAVA